MWIATIDLGDDVINAHPGTGASGANAAARLQALYEREGTPTPHTLPPTHRIAFPGADNIWSVDFSPDGETAYCLVDGQAIDLWAAGMNRWPEGLGVLLGLAMIVYLFVFVRVRRHPQVRGEPHCRACNYLLVAHAPLAVKPGEERRLPGPGTLCPECGVDLSKKRPRRGRSHFRRLWLPTVVLALCVAGYALLFVFGMPRAANAPDAPQLWWPAVDRYAEQKQIGRLLLHRVPVTRLFTAQTRSGTIGRLLRTFRGYSSADLRVAPDGRHIAVAEMPDKVRWISARTGRVVATTTGGQFEATGGNEGFLLRIDDQSDGTWVYYRAVDQSKARSLLLRWNPTTREQRLLIDEQAHVRTMRSGASVASARRYALLRRPGSWAVASAPDFMQAYDQKKYAVTLYAASSGQTQNREIERSFSVPGGEQSCSSPLLATDDGRRLFVSRFLEILELDPNTGEIVSQVRPTGIEAMHPEGPTGAGPSQRLYVPVHPNAVLVYDLATRAWVARLTYPAAFIAPRLHESLNGRWIAAVPFRRAQGSNGYVREFFLCDLDPLQKLPK